MPLDKPYANFTLGAAIDNSQRLCRLSGRLKGFSFLSSRVSSSKHERLKAADRFTFVDSTDGCNTFVKHLSRGSVPQGLPGPLV